jgi:hypothetical protein
MKNKRMLPVMAVLAMAVAPAYASAGSPEIDSKLLNEGKVLSFTISGGTTELSASGEPRVRCFSNEGSGRYTNKTTGEIAITLTACKLELGLLNPSCHSTGQPTGIIVFNPSVFHNVYLTDAKTTPGILITPPSSGVFTTIECPGFSNVALKGTGVIGDLESPKCGGSSTGGTIFFGVTSGMQAYKQNTATGSVFNLTYTTEGGSTTEAALFASSAVTFAESITVTCV